MQRIAEQVALQLAADEATERAHGEGAFDLTTRARRGPQDPPDLQEVASRVHAGETRQPLAALYGVSVYAVDKWLGRARRAGLLPPPKTGRPANRKVQQ